MRITDGKKETKTKLRKAEMPEGKYKAVIESIQILKNCNTKYGQSDAIDISYRINQGICDMEKRERIFVSHSAHSKFMRLIKEMYGYDLPDRVELDKFKGRLCIIEIEHEKDRMGNIYDKVVERTFLKKETSKSASCASCASYSSPRIKKIRIEWGN